MLNEDIKKSIDESVLCWLATVGVDNVPNVSPKQAFMADGDNHLLIANIASPNSVNNIQHNNAVCVSFVDVFKQKGFKLKGTALVIDKSDAIYEEKHTLFSQIACGKFPIHSVIQIKITEVSPIIAPSYWLFPDTTEQQQIEQAMQSYGVKPIS